MQLLSRSSQLFKALSGSGYSGYHLSPEQAEYLREWSAQQVLRYNNIYNRYLLPLFLTAATLSYFFAPSDQKYGMVAAFLVGCVEGVLWIGIVMPLFKKSITKLIFWRALFGYLFAVASYGYLLVMALQTANKPLSEYLAGGLILGAVILFICMSVAVLGGFIFVLGILISLMTLFTFGAYGVAHPWIPALGVLGVSAAVSFIFMFQLQRSRGQALLAWEAQQLAMQNERLRLQAIEQELQVASKLHEAFIQSYQPMKIGGRQVNFFRESYGLLGGDWLAVRPTGDGGVIIAVGDVTGKGIPAAMVVQAIQSLWTESLENPSFDAGQWLTMVNATLVEMGRREPHSLTLGVVVLTRDRLCYYSAGHVPLYLIHSADEGASVEAISALGSVLGLSREVYFEPRIVELSQQGREVILIGTDGVLDWQTRRSRRRLLALAQDVYQYGQDALSQRPADDDQILVMVRPA
jgi:hypothetical protein